MTAELTHIGSEPLSNSIKRLLLRRIVSGELNPGERIVESRLAKELEISQSPVREALRDLAAAGLVDIESRRGARVRKPSPSELQHVSEVRAELDAMVARKAAALMSDDDLAELRVVHETMESCRQGGDYVAMTEADAEFHRCIYKAADNSAALRMFNQLDPFSRTFVTLSDPSVPVGEIVTQHSSILEALEQRDATLAADAARGHQLWVCNIFFDDAAAAVEAT